MLKEKASITNFLNFNLFLIFQTHQEMERRNNLSLLFNVMPNN